MNTTISRADFEKVELRVGTILEAKPFPEARKPAYQLLIDFGPDIGIKKSSAQITHHYTIDSLKGKRIIGVVNFPPKQIGPFVSECLVTGCADDDGYIVLASIDGVVTNGQRLI